MYGQMPYGGGDPYQMYPGAPFQQPQMMHPPIVVSYFVPVMD